MYELDGQPERLPRWKRWMHTALPGLLSTGLLSVALGVVLGSWPNVLLGVLCLGGFARGVLDPQIRRGGYR